MEGVVAFAGYLVYLVDEDDALFGLLHVVVAGLEQSRQQRFYVLAYVTGLGQHRCIDDSEGDVEQAGYGADEQRLAGAGGSHHDDVRLFYLHAVVSGVFLLASAFLGRDVA